MKWLALVVMVLAGCMSPHESPTVLFVGDSYTAGTALADTSHRWSSMVSRDQGWSEVNAGCPGSGFTQSAVRCGTFAQRLPELASLDASIVIIAGGINDWASPNPQPDIAATLDLAAAQWPEADIWVVSALVSINAIVASEAAERGMRWIDLGQPLLGADDAMAGDRLHPNEAGHQLIAQAFLGASHSPG